MKTITVSTDVDLDDVIYEIETEDLIKELKRRRSPQIEFYVEDLEIPIFKDYQQQKNYILRCLGLRRFEFSNKERILSEFNYLLSC